MIEQMHQYYNDEKTGTIIAVIAGIVLVAIATVLWKYFSENPVSKGLSMGFFITGTLILVIGVSGTFYNNQKRGSIEDRKGETEISLQQSEIARMDKVMNRTFRYAFITFGFLMIGALGLTLFTSSYYWKGFGLSMVLFVFLLMLSDTFSMYRNGKYQQTIQSAAFNKAIQ